MIPTIRVRLAALYWFLAAVEPTPWGAESRSKSASPLYIFALGFTLTTILGAIYLAAR